MEKDIVQVSRFRIPKVFPHRNQLRLVHRYLYSANTNLLSVNHSMCGNFEFPRCSVNAVDMRRLMLDLHYHRGSFPH